MRNNKIRIIVNDDQDIYREGILQIIRSDQDFQLVATIQPGEDIVAVVEDTQPNVLITAIQNKNADGVAATKAISEKFPQVGVLAISMFYHERIILSVLHAGAMGCLLRNAKKKELAQAIRAVYKLEPYYSLEIRGMLGEIVSKNDFKRYLFNDYEQLTDKDKLLLRLLCQESTLKEIASELKMTLRSVEHRKYRLFEVLQKSNTAGLINYAIINGIYNPFESAV